MEEKGKREEKKVEKREEKPVLARVGSSPFCF